MKITTVTTTAQISTTATLASQIWHEYYPDIISKAQINYMLETFQSALSIKKQIDSQTRYFLLQNNDEAIGYFACIVQSSTLFLSKCYILKDYRNMGYGKQIINEVSKLALSHQLKSITLTVNIHNHQAISAYKKMGFIKHRALIQDIGAGFVMDDYEFIKTIILSDTKSIPR